MQLFETLSIPVFILVPNEEQAFAVVLALSQRGRPY